MAEQNILNLFFKEIGIACNTNQFMELAIRLMRKGCSCSFQDDLLLKKMAHGYGLSISNYTNDISQNVVFCYLTTINSCLQEFLSRYKKLVGSATHNETYDNRSDEGKLLWTIRMVSAEMGAFEKDAVNICEYYRLLRNQFIHSGEGSSRINVLYGKLQNVAGMYKKSKLSKILCAPSDKEHLNYDDQVLFARASCLIAEFIYKNTKYNWNAILESKREKIKPFLKRSERNTNCIISMLRKEYPIGEEEKKKLTLAIDAIMI